MEVTSRDEGWSGYKDSSDSIDESAKTSVSQESVMSLSSFEKDLTFYKIDAPHDTPNPSKNEDCSRHLNDSNQYSKRKCPRFMQLSILGVASEQD